MDREVFLMLQKDTVSLLDLLTVLKEYYEKKSHQEAVNDVDKSIIAGNDSLLLIYRQLYELPKAS
jgi:hypothetical protein